MNDNEQRTGGEVDIDSRVALRYVGFLALGVLGALLLIGIVRMVTHSGEPVAKPTPATTEEAAETVTLTIDFGEGEPQSYELPARGEATLLELMEAARDDASLAAPQFSYRGEGASAFLESIGGVANEGGDGKYWRFYTNGKLADQSFGVYQPEQGAVILWKFAPAD